MSFGSASSVIVALLGLVLALFFAVAVMLHLVRVRKLTPLVPSPVSSGATSAADEVPAMRFRGEAFESTWHGSLGYARAPSEDEARAADGRRSGENWTGRMVIAEFMGLRPSRFDDPKYWTRYLPGVLATWLVLFVILPIVVFSLTQPSSGAVGTFVPSAQQRAVPHRSADYTDPAPCARAATSVGPTRQPILVTYNDDGTIIAVPHDGTVEIRYLYDRPVFSPGTPLCAEPASVVNGSETFRSSASGSGFVYIPQPSGTVVVKVEIARDFTALVVLLLTLSVLVIGLDIVLTIRLRRATSARYTGV